MRVKTRDKKLKRLEEEYQNISVDSLHEKIAFLESRLEMAKHKISTLDAEK